MLGQGAGRHFAPRAITAVALLGPAAFVANQFITVSAKGAILMAFWLKFDAATSFKLESIDRAQQSANDTIRHLWFDAAANTPISMDFGPYGLYLHDSERYWALVNVGAGVNITRGWVALSDAPDVGASLGTVNPYY